MSVIEEWDKAKTLLGKRVRVMLDLEDKNAVAQGKLLSLCDDGAMVVLDDMGTKHYCWPLLKIVEL